MNRATSLYLDIVRPVAALTVLLSHLGMESVAGGLLQMFSRLGVQAVDVFFVLSGFVIPHVCATRETSARTYACSRAIRIYSVALPAIVVTILLDRIGMSLAPSAYPTDAYQPITPGLLLRCLSFLNEQWNTHRYPGSDGPFWSLGFEVWYYVAFGVFCFVPRGWRWLATAGVLVFVGPKVALLFPVWLLGVATYHLSNRVHLASALGWTLFIAPVLALVAYQYIAHPSLQPFEPLSLSADRLLSAAQDYGIGLLFCTSLIGFVTVSTRVQPLLERLAPSIRWVAGATFTIYLMHLPVLRFIVAVSPRPVSAPGTSALLLIGTLAACFVLASLFERRKAAWKGAADSVMNWVRGPILRLRG